MLISAAMDFWMITFESFEGPSASCGASQLCCKKLPRWGLTCRLRRRGGTWRMVFFARRNRRGAGGNGGKYQLSRLSAEGGNDPEFRQTTSGAHGSAGRADCLPRGKPPACSSTRQLCCKKSPRRGLTRRLRRGWKGVVLSFEAKESTKESQRHGDSGKKPLIAHFDGGAHNVARNKVR